jgi:hypothetical protein
LYNTTNYLLKNYYFEKNDNKDIYTHLKQGIEKVKTKYDVLLSRLEAEKYKPILMRPPFQWAQSLHHIYIEVKYAYRHDVAGCATLYNETVNMTEDKIYITAMCREQDNHLKFEVEFPFWGKVNASSLKWEYQAVGKHYIVVDKLTRPARWQTLFKEGTPRPPMMKLWFE